jgi:hypothetical protein
VISRPAGVDLSAQLVLPPVPSPDRIVHPAVIPSRGIRSACACRAPGATTNHAAGPGGLVLVAATLAIAARRARRRNQRPARRRFTPS